MGFFRFGANQPFLHHSAINIDDPELFEAIEAKFRRLRPNTEIISFYHGPKLNCFERCPIKPLKSFSISTLQCSEISSCKWIDKSVVAFSRNQKFEAAVASFRLFNGGLPDAIVESERPELLMTNLKYLMGKLDIPVVRVFEFVKTYKDLLVQGSVLIQTDYLKS